MVKTINTLFFFLIITQSIWGQTGQLISSTYKPSLLIWTTNTEINSVKIYEQLTVVSISFTCPEDDAKMIITSKATICDYYNQSDELPIIEFSGNELDKIYSLGKKGK